jgi:DNA-binding helix-hairpin-helix protein with protein kinase domain
MQTWLNEIDKNQYAQSWTEASASFQKAVTSDQWIAALNGVRTPLGKCTVRKLASSMHQTEVPSPTGPQKGDFVVAQFNSSFENLAYAVETVCFEKASDGRWKASGYYVKPKP